MIIISTKIDFKKCLKELYKPSSKEISIIDVPTMQYLMIDGMGSPGECQEYFDCIETLYPVAFRAKFLSKKVGKDYVVPPLEGLWWADDMNDFTNGNRDKWKWTLMIMQPEWITQNLIDEAIEIVKKKKTKIVKNLLKLRFENLNEGKIAQIMHLGPYSEEGPTIEKLHQYIKDNGGDFDGFKQKHHEIYLSDPRKAKSENIKTIIRQPFI